jgi:multicomponent Na+:H+ antiporter subunit E
MIKKILIFVLWFLVWLILSWPPAAHDVITGSIVSLVVSLMTFDILTEGRKSPLKNPLRYLWFIYYALIFLWECVKANIDVAYRVIHPDLPIRPGVIKMKTSLTSNTALTFLANSITLTPGTTTVDIDKNNGYIYVHWLYVKEGCDECQRSPAVVRKFEKVLKRIFE